jgi:hypothetical protein
MRWRTNHIHFAIAHFTGAMDVVLPIIRIVGNEAILPILSSISKSLSIIDQSRQALRD